MDTLKFIEDDNNRSLFPLRSNLFFAKAGESTLRDFIYSKLLKIGVDESFLSVPVAYALKDRYHLRKLLLLDPIATFYFYDFILRNSKAFQSPRVNERMQFGYAFQRKTPRPPTPQYHAFRKRKYELKAKYKHFAKIDISNCFNSFYHHDITRFVAERVSDAEGRQFGQFLREINSGTSINCFPQGIYPAKTLGNFYLSFIETNRGLRSPAIIRFLDDIFLFANNRQALEQDVIVLQQILGTHSLSLNAEKTQFGSQTSDFEEKELDEVKRSLLKKRERIIDYDDDDDEVDLEEEEREYLEDIASRKQVAEEDLELALALVDKGDAVVNLIRLVCSEHPHLIKQAYRLWGESEYDDDGAIWEIIDNRAGEKFLTEYELFWLAKMVVDLYGIDDQTVDVLMKIYEHPRATPVVQGVVLENAENGYGFLELKETQLRDTPGGIAAICALAGLRKTEKSKRNHVCKYVAKTGPYAQVLAGIVARLRG